VKGKTKLNDSIKFLTLHLARKKNLDAESALEPLKEWMEDNAAERQKNYLKSIIDDLKDNDYLINAIDCSTTCPTVYIDLSLSKGHSIVAITAPLNYLKTKWKK
jgi:hypothetical protein